MKPCPVSSFTEWEPLEEVIVGILEGTTVMPWEPGYAGTAPPDELEEVKAFHTDAGGFEVPAPALAAAQGELAELVRILEGEGVTVRRPDPVPFARPYGSLHWDSAGGNSLANPRDVLLVVGDRIIEAGMSLRSRYFELTGYRRLLKEYFAAGARWTAAPKPVLPDALYQPPEPGNPAPGGRPPGKTYVTTELEPVFDAADFARFGKDIFVQRSHVTNRAGFEWVRRYLGDEITCHLVEFENDRMDHIDSTFVPLAPGKLLVNPDRPIKGGMPAMFEKAGWDVLPCPRTALPEDMPGYSSLRWLHMNLLMLDEKRVIVERGQEPMIAALRRWGFEPIPCSFTNNYKFGGSFHCATVDVRRRGELKSYF